MKERECVVCNGPFTPTAAVYSPRKTCSDKCRYKLNSIAKQAREATQMADVIDSVDAYWEVREGSTLMGRL